MRKVGGGNRGSSMGMEVSAFAWRFESRASERASVEGESSSSSSKLQVQSEVTLGDSQVGAVTLDVDYHPKKN